jgi:hypothetical protein
LQRKELCKFEIVVNLEQTIFTSTSTCRDELFTVIKPDVRVWVALTDWMFRSRKYTERTNISRPVKDACLVWAKVIYDFIVYENDKIG